MCKPFVLLRWNPPVASTFFLSHPLRVPPVTFQQVLLCAAFFTDRFIFHLGGRSLRSNHASPLADWLVCCQTRFLILSRSLIENYVHFGERTIYNVQHTPLVSVRKEETACLLLLFSTAVILLQQDYRAIEQDTSHLWKFILNPYIWQWSSEVYVVIM